MTTNNDLPFYENAYREVLLQEVTISEEEADIIETWDRHQIGTRHLMQNVLGARYRDRWDRGE